MPITRKQADAEFRKYLLSQMRKTNPKFAKTDYFKEYKRLGGRLTYAQATRKPKKKR